MAAFYETDFSLLKRKRAKTNLKYTRWAKYYYLRFIRLRGEPHALALGIAFGVFAGLMPIMPFQMALALSLALFFKASKITAALGTWISNPLNWYFLYYYSYKIGASLLGLSGKNKLFASVMDSVQRGDGPMMIIGKIVGAGSAMMGSFFIGGLVIAVIGSIPAYFFFLWVFQRIHQWRQKRKA